MDRILNMQITEPTQTEFFASIISVPKKVGNLRIRVRYRKINGSVSREHNPILRMDECIDSFCEAAIFSRLAGNSAHWKLKIEESHGDKTTFTSRHGLYRFIWMLFGLRNTPGTFQRTMVVILAIVEWQFGLVYLENIMKLFETPEEHTCHVREVLKLLNHADVTFNFEMCQFFTETIDVMRCVLRGRRLEISFRTTKAKCRLHEPTIFTELRSILGLCKVF